eukprot:TRINITY_DN11077_c0_g1_i7.p1 TRINITY_DN11077_c0_g1~~TRINITY_DN11077_c0_g1_i7.p1  ORF type:complete len:314 (-),score=56.69 TRINITY_DN11077_c0_g1_i7:83-1024(-)
MKRQESRKKKFDIWLRLWKCLGEYKKILIINRTNMSANILKEARSALQPLGAKLLIGKNTLIKAGIRRKMQKPVKSDEDYKIRSENYKPMPELEKLLNICNGDIALIFCKDNLDEVRNKLKEFEDVTSVKTGSIAPCDYFLLPGITTLRPPNYNFFKFLNVLTKISKGFIEIIYETKLLTKGRKILESQRELLNCLKIKPFTLKIPVAYIYDNGIVYNSAVLDIADGGAIFKVSKGANCLKALAVEANYPTALCAKYMLLAAFNNMFAVTLSTVYDFKEAKAIKKAKEDEQLRLKQAEENIDNVFELFSDIDN